MDRCQEIWEPLVPSEFQRRSVLTNALVPRLQGKSVWTDGPESSSRVSPEAGIGP